MPGVPGLSFLLIFDLKRVMFSSLVVWIFSRVIFFSCYYISQEIQFVRFIVLLVVFGGRMLIFVHSARIPLILLGWDGLGISSFLLVIFFQGLTPLKSGLLTVLSNRIGDCLILLSCWAYYYSPETSFWFTGERKILSVWYVVIIIRGITKRAQLPFSSWLPAAIAAPTPVSALVHSSTLVTAGVYLVWRVSEVLTANTRIFTILILVGLSTAIFARIRAFSENDVKKVVALSTLRQIGVIFIILGFQLFDFIFYHLIVHAFLKALLFLTVGNMIHNSRDYQHVAKVNLQSTSNKISLAAGIGANLRLIGIVFMGAFYSKDLFLEKVLRQILNLFVGVGLVVTIRLTAAYSFRLLKSIIRPQFRRSSSLEVHENSAQFFIAVVILYLAILLIRGLLSNFVLERWFFYLPNSRKIIFFCILGLGFRLNSFQDKVRRLPVSRKNLWGLNEFLIKGTWRGVIRIRRITTMNTISSEFFIKRIFIFEKKLKVFTFSIFIFRVIIFLAII